MTTAGATALPDPGSELSRLTAGFLDGSLTLADRDRLVALLREPQARAAYRRTVWLHANLLRLWSQEIGVDWAPQPAKGAEDDGLAAEGALGSRRGVRFPQLLAERLTPWALRAAALGGIVALVVAVAAALFLPTSGLLGPRSQPAIARPPRVAGAIGEIAANESPVWAPGGRAWSLWDGLLPGAVLELQSGRIELSFDGGAQVVLEGPAGFVVDGAKAVALRRGKATVTVRDNGSPVGQPRFTVQTPSTTLTDIGTSFGVAVDEAGETYVNVFEGLVDMLPRTDGAVPMRLAAGEAGQTSKQQIPRKAAPRERGFVRSLERPSPDLQTVLATYGWDEARATTIYRDSFTGSGPLSGSRPADRGGLGDAAWVAPGFGWQLDAARASVAVTAHGSALLPVAIEPGRLYLVSAAIRATAGGIGWGAVGFTNQSRPEPYEPHGPWILQRHDVVKYHNESHVGPGEARPVGRGDRLVGEHVRSLLLDTTGPTWRVAFLVDGKVVGESRIESKQAGITHVCLAAFPNTQVSFRHFSISSSSRSTGR